MVKPPFLMEKPTFFDGRTTFFDGETTFFDGTTTFFDGKTTFFDGTTTFFDGKTTFFDGRTPIFHGEIYLFHGETSRSEPLGRCPEQLSAFDLRGPWAPGGSHVPAPRCVKTPRNVLICLFFFRVEVTIVTSSTAQGGGGSFKNRKPIGEVGCCESEMAERSH